MKAYPPVKHLLLSCGIATVVLFTSLSNVARADDDTTVQHSGDVSFVSGGVGQESLDQLNAMSHDFNLKLVFALNSGAYLSGVQVGIVDGKGKTVVDAMSNGPWFMAKLPSGNYQVMATVAGKVEQRRVAVGPSQIKTVDFRWASE